MAQQADNIGGIQIPTLSPMELAAEAAEAERQEHIEQASQQARQQTKHTPRKKRVGEEQEDFGLSRRKKETRIAVALSLDPDMNENLSTASFKLKMTRSAIIEQLFNQWWEENGDKIKALQ